MEGKKKKFSRQMDWWGWPTLCWNVGDNFLAIVIDIVLRKNRLEKTATRDKYSYEIPG